jgi:hypothetical protein
MIRPNHYANDTILFKNNNIKITADNIKLFVACNNHSMIKILVFVDISNDYKFVYCLKNKHRRKQLILIGEIIIDIYLDDIKYHKFINFINEDCDITINASTKSKYGYYQYDLFTNNYHGRNYKKYITLTNYDRINYREYNGVTMSVDIRNKGFYNNIINLLEDVFHYSIFNNNKFCYRITNLHYYDSNSAGIPYKIFISKRER